MFVAPRVPFGMAEPTSNLPARLFSAPIDLSSGAKTFVGYDGGISSNAGTLVAHDGASVPTRGYFRWRRGLHVHTPEC